MPSDNGDTNLRPPVKKWVLVDIGPEWCKSSTHRCPSGDPDNVLYTERTGLAQLMKDVLDHEPRVVVFDISTVTHDSSHIGDHELKKILANSRVPVLLYLGGELFGNEYGRSTVVVDAKRQIFPFDDKETFPRFVRMMPAAKSQTTTKARYLEADYTVIYNTGQGDIIDRKKERQPGIAYAAAMVSRMKANNLAELFDLFPTAYDSDKCPIRKNSKCSQFSLTERILSFRREFASTDHYGNAQFMYAYLALESGSVPVSGNFFKDAVVVIGNTDQKTGDRTDSAVGDISGPELILNDIRQYSLTLESPEPLYWIKLVKKLPYCSAIFLATFIVCCYAHNLSKKMSSEKKTHPMVVLHSIKFLEILGIYILASLFFAIMLTSFPAEPGQVPDFVTPFFGLMIEGLFEIFKLTTDILREALRGLMGVRPRLNH